MLKNYFFDCNQLFSGLHAQEINSLSTKPKKFPFPRHYFYWKESINSFFKLLDAKGKRIIDNFVVNFKKGTLIFKEKVVNWFATIQYLKFPNTDKEYRIYDPSKVVSNEAKETYTIENKTPKKIFHLMGWILLEALPVA
jgi:hypothetical protein